MELLLQLPHTPSWPEQGQVLQQDTVSTGLKSDEKKFQEISRLRYDDT